MTGPLDSDTAGKSKVAHVVKCGNPQRRHRAPPECPIPTQAQALVRSLPRARQSQSLLWAPVELEVGQRVGGVSTWGWPSAKEPRLQIEKGNRFKAWGLWALGDRLR